MDRAQKLAALRHVGMAMQGDPAVISLLAFFAGRLDRVHFVSDLEGAGYAVTLSVSPRIWPRIPFRATIEGMPVPHPLAFIERAALDDEDIYVKVDFGAAEPPEWYRAVMETEVQDPRQYVEAAMRRVRQEIDLALDVYRTASEALEANPGDEEHREYLRFALRNAREEIRTLSGRLEKMEAQLGQIKS